MRILLTGAAGRIGTAFYTERADSFWFRLADRVTPSFSARPDHEVIALDIADLAACRTACEGIDQVIHLAADPRPHADFYESLLDSNIKGTYNIFRAARDAGCHRVIFASSVHAVAGYPDGTAIGTDARINPVTVYGATKCFGEALASYFSNSENLSCIAVRIGAYDAPWIRDSPTRENLAAYISPRDLNQLFVRCLEAPDSLRFAIVNGQSNNREPRLDLTSTRAAVGFDPLDDGFALYGSRIS